MKTKLLVLACLVISTSIFTTSTEAQSCLLSATASTMPSECKATGSIAVTAVNGSGNYNYTVIDSSFSSTTSSNIIGGLQAGVYTVLVKDIVNGCSVQLNNVTVGGSYQDPRFTLTATNATCNGAANGAITVGNVQYGTPPFSYSIVSPSASGVGTTNSTGFFPNLIPGNYTVQLNDSCGGMQTRIITIANYTWSITGTSVVTLNCDSAVVTLTATDNYGNTNTSGNTFTGYMYGYIIAPADTLWSSNHVFTFYKGGVPRSANFVIKDPCGNVIASSWLNNSQPSANKTVSISNQSCSNFTASISGQQNLTNPQYCLYSGTTLITCNNSGTFNTLSYGSYSIQITDNCYDTTFTRNFTVTKPKPTVSSVNISNQGCSSFTATVSASNITNGQYCLFDTTATIACNTTGVFNNLSYGSYCLHVKNDSSCYDTLIVTCFSATQLVPSVNSSVTITDGCTSFSGNLGGQTNLTNPQFCLYDANNNQLSCNTSGQFSNLPYGSYCIKMTNSPSCYDTVITRCFTASATPITMTLKATPSCTIGASNLNVQLANGIAPYIVKVYNTQGTLLDSLSVSGNSTTITGIPVVGTGSYKVIAVSSCGAIDSATFTPQPSTLTKSISAVLQCPGGTSQNGLGNLTVNVAYNGGKVTPSIISQNGSTVNISYSSVSGTNYTFSNLAPATYIVQYTLSKCSNMVYDTFVLKPYAYPSLAQSAVYQCNNNSFSVSAFVTGGLSPYTYAIIGSVPSAPSIIQGPQASPIFSINNGNAYSVVRLRAVDACGNATINDASILPLANTIVTATSNCIHTNTVLSVDSIPNATYIWYKRTAPNDSVQVGTGTTYAIPDLSVSDTGMYVNVESVNSGCLTKISTYYVDGVCLTVLALNDISFTGAYDNGYAQLKWSTSESFNADHFIVQRSTDGINFTSIGSVSASSTNNISSSQYYFSDPGVANGKNFYRLQIVQLNQSYTYTNIIEIDKNESGASILVMPNPVSDAVNIKFSEALSGNYNVSLINPEGKILLTTTYSIASGETKTIQRTSGMATGIYFLSIQNQSTSDKQVIKLFFK